MSAIHFDVERPASYERGQLLIRIFGMIALAVIGAPLGWVFCVAYFALPVLAAAAGSHERYAPALVRVFRWLLAIYAYLGLLTDRAPLSEQSLGIHYEVEPSGTPTTRSALMHLLTSIPAAIFLWILGILSAIAWVIAAIAILVSDSYPASIFDFQRGVLRMFARFLTHHASLVPGPAPVSFDTGPEPDRATFAA